MDAPTLRTQRLVLLPLGTADLDEAAPLYDDPGIMQYVDGGTRDRTTTANLLEANVRCWKSEGWGRWAIRDAETGAFLGEGGLQRLTDVFGAEVHLGIILTRRAWAQGFGTEAAIAIVHDAWDRYRGDEIHALTDPDNAPAESMLRKAGFRRLEDQLVHGSQLHVWVVQRLM